ncbi:SH3 domain-containing protein [Hymenobacter cheonanensis]|uniref:SH3 domain-containing protein n=1 Tax=Hymenobacter sp. CA2-7 TaxID=3063993 RepID=UPI0027132331|nr:SH3 domain-containing protein [Hymenobacter sp. CA2-7]MDO7885990.1 SH3 domain-containing protein [Hymenobacter sp. CA2-7]
MPRILLLLLTYLLPLWSSAQTATASDSLIQTETSLAYRYVNATSLTLRARPDATAKASAIIAGASRLQLVAERPDGWSQVQVAGHTGYVRTDYLVEEQNQVTANVDWASVEAAGGSAYSSTSSAPRPTTASHKVSPKVAAGPKVYVCGNGRTEVYHSSEDCSAMRRCTYQTLVMTQREAQASGLRGCMKCY